MTLKIRRSMGRPSRCQTPEIPLIFRQYTARVVRESPIPDSAVVAIAADVLGSELGSEVVMLSLRDGTYYGLEDVGAEVWRLLQHPVTIRRIVEVLVDTYDVSATRCRADVINLVADLRDRGLVDVRDAA
jgi:hypothetical protein